MSLEKAWQRDKKIVDHLMNQDSFVEYLRGVVGVLQMAKVDHELDTIQFIGATSQMTASLSQLLETYGAGDQVTH